MWKKAIAAIMALTLGGTVYANCANVTCQSIHIDRLYLNAAGPVYVATDDDESALNCTPVSNVYLTLNTSDPNADYIYSTLLAAYVAGNPVSIRIDDLSPVCEIRYIFVDR